MTNSRYLCLREIISVFICGYLNDINGFHVKKEHALAALQNAKGGAVAEGNVGAGAGAFSVPVVVPWPYRLRLVFPPC